MILRLKEVYFPILESEGITLSVDFKLSGHSFRRGGINAIRDAARRDKVDHAALKALLMAFGRWSDERSVLIYLVENWEELAMLTRRI